MSFLNGIGQAIRKMRGGVVDMSAGQISVDNETFWKFLNELWESAKTKEKESKESDKYWEGKLDTKLTMTNIFKDQSHSNDNIIQPICETKISNLLDAQFEIAVVPEIGSFSDMNSLKDAQAVADILNDEIKNVEKANNGDVVDELVCRDGENTGLGASQVEWSTQKKPEGEVVITHVPAKDVRWIDNVLIGYKKEYSVQEAKELFCKNENGEFVEELCKEIDKISEIRIGDKDRKYSGAVINYTDDDNNTAGQAFASKRGHMGGIQAGKVVNLITLYLLDDSVYAPEENGDSDTEEAKAVFKKAFPNGRKIIFNADKEEKLIISDEPLPESFRNLGNIDIYNPIIKNGISGESPLKVIYPIQDRIDGLYSKYRLKVQWDIDTQLIDEAFGVEENALVISPVTKVKDFNDRKGQMSEPLTNNGIEKGARILEAIENLKQSAYEKAGINQTMMSGYRQTGTTSAEQVEALNESPLVKIRRQQRNFKNYRIARAEKCLMFIMQNYTDQRFIALSTGIDGAKMARIVSDPKSNQKSIELLKEANGAIQSLKSIAFNDKWRFKVECSAGTEIPRSRKEMAMLTDKIAASPIMASGDLDMMEMYLTANDYPQRRALMTLLRSKKEEAEKPENKTMTARNNLLNNPQISQGVASLIKSLDGFSSAKAQILATYGLDGKTDTLMDAPIQSVTAKSQAEDIAEIAPGQISRDPVQAAFGHEQAIKINSREKGAAILNDRIQRPAANQ